MKSILPVTLSLLVTPVLIMPAPALLCSALAGPADSAQPAGAAAKPDQAAPKPVQVSIDNFQFSPSTLTVPVGTQVTWLNGDDVPHTVVSTRGAFRSRALDTGDKFSFTFRTKGTYAYFCSVHPMMTAKVIVR